MRGIILILALIWWLLPTHAFGDRVTEAKLRFEQGAALINASQVRKGLNELLISNRLAPNPNTLLNVARSLDYLKYYEYAYLVYEEYLRSPIISASDRADAKNAFETLERKVARLFIETDPKDAEIFLNREALGGYGNTPRGIAAKAGRHTVILKAPEHQTRRVEVNLAKGVEKKLSVALRPVTGEIFLSTKSWSGPDKPQRIEVRSNSGKRIGDADETLELPVGEQTLMLNAKGFEPLEITVQVEPMPVEDFDSDNFDDAELEPQNYAVELSPIKGSARILANQIGALIYLDGKEVGFTPQVIDAAVGPHELRLELTGFNPWEGTFDVSKPPEQVVGEIEFRRPRQSSIHPAWPWSMAGVAVLSAGLSATLAYQGIQANDRLPNYPTELDVTDGNRSLLIADGAGVISILSGVASYLHFRSRRESSADQPRARFYKTHTPLEEMPPFEDMPTPEEIKEAENAETSLTSVK